jgi:DNA ligase (NAD+)
VAPRECPACAAALEESDSGVALRCPNRACPAQIKRRLEYFVSSSGLNIRGFGPGLVATLVDRGLVKDVDGIFRLDAAAWSEVAGAKTGTRLAAEISQAKNADAVRVVAALGLSGLGPTSARQLMTKLRGLGGLRGATSAQLQAAGLSAAASAELAAELARPEVDALLVSLMALGIGPRPAD